MCIKNAQDSENYIRTSVQDAQLRRKKHFDKRHNVSENEFHENDTVLIKNRKRKKGMEKQNWLGPYVIDKVVKNGTYRVNEMNGSTTIGTFKQMSIKKYNREFCRENQI